MAEIINTDLETVIRSLRLDSVSRAKLENSITRRIGHLLAKQERDERKKWDEEQAARTERAVAAYFKKEKKCRFKNTPTASSLSASTPA